MDLLVRRFVRSFAGVVRLVVWIAPKKHYVPDYVWENGGMKYRPRAWTWVVQHRSVYRACFCASCGVAACLIIVLAARWIYISWDFIVFISREAWNLSWQQRTSAISMLGFIAVPFTLAFKWHRNGMREMKEHFVKHLLESVLPAFCAVLCLFGWNVFVAVPRVITQQSNQTFPFPRLYPLPQPVAFIRALPNDGVASRSLNTPVVHIEPEGEIVWSTLPGQKLGVFTVQLHNTGTAVDVMEVRKKYFLAQHGNSGVVIKRLPEQTDDHKGLLDKGKSFPLSLDFNPFVDDIAEVTTNFKEGPSRAGVQIIAKFRRHSDGKNFDLSQAYGCFTFNGPDGKLRAGAIVTVQTTMDYAAPEPMRSSYLTLHEILPFLDSPERWTSITKEVTVGPDGKMHVRQF
jgi:hypothetical protein